MNPSCDGTFSDTPIISLDFLTLSSSFAGANNWYLNGVLIPNETGSTLRVYESGTYFAAASSSNCLSGISNEIFVSEQVVGVKEIFVNFNIFPNPVNGVLNVNFDNLEREAIIKIIDILGKEVFAITTNKLINSIDINHLNKGIYSLEISNNKNVYSKKIVKK